jgi:hypothetical protein
MRLQHPLKACMHARNLRFACLGASMLKICCMNGVLGYTTPPMAKGPWIVFQRNIFQHSVALSSPLRTSHQRQPLALRMSQRNLATVNNISITPLKITDTKAVDETVALLSDAFSHEKDPYSWGRYAEPRTAIHSSVLQY